MRTALLFLLMGATAAFAQQPAAGSTENEAQREAWKMTPEQYRRVDPSRRPGGATYIYWKERNRGPYGNLLERVPGGPRRPVKV